MCGLDQWLLRAPDWRDSHKKLFTIKTNSDTVKSNEVLKDVVFKSENFPIKFPTCNMLTKNLLQCVSEEILRRNIQSAYPIIHERALFLCAQFLLFKSDHGSTVERKLYKDMTLIKFIQRLLTKRAVSFINKNDYYVLRDGTYNYGSWETIGTEHEKEPLVLVEYLSYAEMKISAFLSVSSFSYFINEGSRYNEGIVADNRNIIQVEGVVMGIIGTILDKKNAMDYQEIVINNQQNTGANGYGFYNICTTQSLFSNFYQDNLSLYNNVRYGNIMPDVHRFTELKNGDIFDNVIYSKRLAVSFDTLLIEANHRAKIAGKFAYIHLVGIGLGNLRISDHQEDVFVKAFGQRLRVLAKHLKHVSDVHLSYFPRTIYCLGCTDGHIYPIDDHPLGGICIYIREANPFTKLNDPAKLLVASYASNANALPGNEFWKGLLSHSGNSCVAASSQVSELQNPFINPYVDANNLHIATFTGVVPFTEYATNVSNKLILENIL